MSHIAYTCVSRLAADQCLSLSLRAAYLLKFEAEF